ncbi:MAG TPA: GntR family transcriptional regulator [Solirubrobacteraceae bacterium]|nr:GntR family transcriptional regulator [Solirubrobacteraceae bacterium]
MRGTRRSLRHSLAEELRARILAGEWRPGERLPSEPELARLSTVSRSSMRAAITVLEEDGFVNRKHGSGTYVAHRPALPSDLGNNFGVSALIGLNGMQPGSAEESSGVVPAPPEVAEALEVDVGAPVGTLRRVRTADGDRVVDVTDWCRVEHIAPDELSGIASIYEELAARGLAVDHGVATLEPRNADGDLARRLGVPRGTLLLTFHQVDRTADGVAVLVSREHHVADAFTFTLLRRGPGEEGR